MEVELPVLQSSLYEVYHDQGLEIMSIDPIDPISVIQNIKSSNGYEFFFLWDPGGQVWNSYNFSTTFPQNFIVDAGGIVRYRQLGFDEQAIIDSVEVFLAESVDSNSWGKIKHQYR